MLNRKTVTLYFLAGMAPTIPEQQDAAQYGRVLFRNASKIVPTDNPEPCDFVAGLIPIPDAYKDVPRASIKTPDEQKAEEQKRDPNALENPPGSAPAPQRGRRSGAKQPDVKKDDSGWGKL